MSDKTYDTLKVFALLVLPIGTCISNILNIWQIPYGDRVMQTFIALDVLCGVIVSVAKALYERRNDDGGSFV